jgi:hypothetical protein
MKRILILLCLLAVAVPAQASEVLNLPITEGRILHELEPPQTPCQKVAGTAVICWDASTTPAASLLGYNIYRARNASDCPGPGQDTGACALLTPTPTTTLAFVDPSPIFGQVFYVVRAVAIGGVESPNSTVITPLPAGSTATAIQVLLRPAPGTAVRPAP